MKRVTFVFIGIMAITGFVLLSQESIENKTVEIVKIDVKKQHVKGIYD